MLFDIGFILLAFIAPVLVFVSYRQGIRDRQKINKDEPLTPVIKLPKRKERASKDDLKYSQLLKNIDNYDGTANGQKEVSI